MIILVVLFWLIKGRLMVEIIEWLFCCMDEVLIVFCFLDVRLVWLFFKICRIILSFIVILSIFWILFKLIFMGDIKLIVGRIIVCIIFWGELVVCNGLLLLKISFCKGVE